jgi:plastocyanin
MRSKSPGSSAVRHKLLAVAGRNLCAILATSVLLMGAGSARASILQVNMERVTYSPAQISAHVGDTLEWVNSDIVAHTTTARSGEWDVMILPNQKKSITLKTAGTFQYYCKFHPNMAGEITATK